MAKKEVYEAIATLVGTVIGAGVLGIPYVMATAGFLTGLIVILVVCGVVTLMYLYYGEVVLRTKGKHQLTGYAQQYLGKPGKYFATASMVIGIYGALTAYILGVGASLKSIFGGSPLAYSLVFFVFVALLVYMGIKAIEKSELILIFLIIAVILAISVLSFNRIEVSNLNHFNLTKILLPYGVIIFAFMGTAAIPEMREILVRNEKELKKSIIIGMAIPLILYIVFTLVVVGVVGLEGFSALDADQRIATIALSSFVGEHLALLGNIFAILAMTTSFLTLGLALREMYEYDFKVKKRLAWALTFFFPLVFAMSRLTDFIQIIGLAGALTGGINACLIVLMFWQAKKKGERKPEFSLSANKALGFMLIFMLLLGTIYGLLSIL